MEQLAAIVDCYTVEPSGLGVPPYLSTYARAAFGALKRAFPGIKVRYLTIDDVRWCTNGGRPFAPAPLSDQLTYSATANRHDALEVLAEAAVLVVIAGDAVPSVHLQARNGSPDEVAEVLALSRGRRVLLGQADTCNMGRDLHQPAGSCMGGNSSRRSSRADAAFRISD